MSAAVLQFRPVPGPTRFNSTDRNAIVAAAMAISPRWGASFFLDDTGSELASVGRQSGGDDDCMDAFGLALVPDGIELLDFEAYSSPLVFRTVGEAVSALRSLAGP
jgi:hypothetical protein